MILRKENEMFKIGSIYMLANQHYFVCIKQDTNNIYGFDFGKMKEASNDTCNQKLWKLCLDDNLIGFFRINKNTISDTYNQGYVDQVVNAILEKLQEEIDDKNYLRKE